jgi:hypothetical protein
MFSLDPNDFLPPAMTDIEEINRKQFDRKEFYAAFTIAALTHDLGYPLQKIVKLNNVVSKILESIGGVDWQPLRFALSLPRHETAQHLLLFLSSKPEFVKESGAPLEERYINGKVEGRRESYKQARSIDDLVDEHKQDGFGIFLRHQWKYHQKYLDSLEHNHHGLLSALFLIRKLLYFKEGEFALEGDYYFTLEEARQFMIRREILRALATHTCPEIYILDLLSIESLLFFCDEIQEWGRPMFSDLYGGKFDPNATKVRIHQFDKKKVSWEVDVGGLQQTSAVHWLLSSGRKLYSRLRSAPETPERSFSVEWVLSWKYEGSQFQAAFSFAGREGVRLSDSGFRYKVRCGEKAIEIMEDYIFRFGREDEKEIQKRLLKAVNNLTK